MASPRKGGDLTVSATDRPKFPQVSLSKHQERPPPVRGGDLTVSATDRPKFPQVSTKNGLPP
jgi:hypothetical protein